MAMVNRYMNVKADDVVAVLHSPQEPASSRRETQHAEEGSSNQPTQVIRSESPTNEAALPDNVVRIRFGAKRSAA